MKVYKNEDRPLRNTIGFEKGLNNKLNTIKNESIENRARSFISSNKKLLQKYIPKLKPIKTNLNPSPIILKEINEAKIEDDNFIMNKNKISNKKLHQLKTVGIKEEIIEKAVNSNDEQCNNLNNNGSDSSDNDSKNNEKKSNKNNAINKNDENISKIKTNFNFCFNTIRKKLDKIKNKIQNKYKDDTNLDFSYENNFYEKYRIKCVQKYIDTLKMKKKEEYEKIRNKTISFKDMKFFKPPILGFLEKNEISNNSTLSSCNLSEV